MFKHSTSRYAFPGIVTLIIFAGAVAHADFIKPPSRLRAACERSLTALGLMKPKTLAHVSPHEVSVVPDGRTVAVQLPDQTEPMVYRRTNRDLFDILSDGIFPREFFNFETLKNFKVLDEGCGGGRLVEELRRQGVDIVGLDVHLTPYQLSKPYFVRAPMQRTGLASGQFDLILATQSGFSYLFSDRRQIRNLLVEAHRLLKRGGRLLISPLYPGRFSGHYLDYGADPKVDLQNTGFDPLPPGLRFKSWPDRQWFHSNIPEGEGHEPFYWLELERTD